MHDIGTFDDKTSCNAVAVATTRKDWTGADAWCLSVTPMNDGKPDALVAADSNLTVETTTGDPFNVAVGAIIQDAAAKGVAAIPGLPEDICDMHKANHVGRSAVGDLARSRGKKPWILFPKHRPR